jgi:pseudaminic acid synthase
MELVVDGRTINTTQAPFVIAELSANHRGSLAATLELIHAAHEAGADAVKFQHFTPDTITVHSDHPDFRISGGTLWDGAQLADLYADAMLPWEWTPELVAEAKKLGIIWLSSPFDRTAVDFLVAFDVPALKIASFEIIDLPLIRYAGAQGRPMIISTGMATVAEIDAAVRAALVGGAPSVALLRCNSGYPADPGEMDLLTIPAMRGVWEFPVGLSDHTIGASAAIASVALGASIIEKHLTLRRTDGGPDAAFSSEPDELKSLVTSVREVHAALGRVRFGASKGEEASLAFRRSLRAVRSISSGEVITAENVRSVRPAGGLTPDEFEAIVGMTSCREIKQGDPIQWSDFGKAVRR